MKKTSIVLLSSGLLIVLVAILFGTDGGNPKNDTASLEVLRELREDGTRERSADTPARGPLTQNRPTLVFKQRMPVMDRLYHDRLEAESAQVISVNLHNKKVDLSASTECANYTIISANDVNFAEGKRVAPLQCGVRQRVVRMARRKNLLVIETSIFLQLPTPMQRGADYDVLVTDIGESIPVLDALVFDDTNTINDNIRLNQLGYLPKGPRYAYVGQYSGTDGGLPFDIKYFEIWDEHDQVVFSGRARRRKVGEERVGQQVWELDLSSFDQSGNYRIHVPQVGLSPVFAVSADALNPAYANLMSGSYHARCGAAIPADFSRHHRPACHLQDAYLDSEVEQLKFTEGGRRDFYPTEYDGLQHDATRGHHDAGDYGKYTSNSARYIFAILHAAEVFPGRFDQDNLSLPSSGNGIPDMLEEVKWELDWLEKMQDEDGAVFGMVKPESGGYENGMPPEKSRRLLYPKDTTVTAAFAGAMAMAARSQWVQTTYPETGQRYLEKALRAWEWLESHPEMVGYHHYGATLDDADERCWAAIELYAATGEKRFQDYFLEHHDPALQKWSWWGLYEFAGQATLTCAFLSSPHVDKNMQRRCKAAVIEMADMHVTEAGLDPYRLSMPTKALKHKRFARYFPGSQFSYNLLMAYALTDKTEYLSWAAFNLDYAMGANPHGYFLYTGLGAKRAIEVVDQESAYDDIIEPAPGIPLGIGSPGIYYLKPYDKTVSQKSYPADWPLLNRWYDGFNVESEFTIASMSREMVVLGFFSQLQADRNEKPTVHIHADVLSGPAPLTVSFRAEVEDVDGQVRQFFWDFDDETFSSDSAPIHTFVDAGRDYSVAVSVIDNGGALAYDEVQVSCVIPEPAYYRVPLEPDENTLALYHFDGNLQDSSQYGVDLRQGVGQPLRQTYTFVPIPSWMSVPAGYALSLDGAERFEVAISAKTALEGPLSIEALLYVEEFAGYGYPDNPDVLGLRSGWDSALALREKTWSKQRAPTFVAGTEMILSDEELSLAIPRNRWTLVTMDWDGISKVRLLVDGKLVTQAFLVPFRPERTPLTLSIGPLRGKVDELRVSSLLRDQ